MSYATAETIAFVRKMREKFLAHNGEKIITYATTRSNAIALQQSIKLLRMDEPQWGEYKIKVENLPPSQWTKHGRQTICVKACFMPTNALETSKDPAMPSDEEIAEAMQEALNVQETREKQDGVSGTEALFSKD